MSDTRSNDDEVICPNCCHQFRAVPVNVQAELTAALARAEAAEKDAEAYRQERIAMKERQ